PDASPLFLFLQQQKGFAGWDMEHPIAHILDDMLSKADPDYREKPDIKWNFTKFLVDRNGVVTDRFEPTEKIENIARRVEALL
ncbi:MAG: glutathione peroxidase, partial [Bacteroidales bacterium]|nr:glutathione peroxidase [Bacteroidales bacterium]